MRIRTSNRRALARTLKALTGLGREHDALVEHAKTLADLVDAFPYEVKLHSEYREALKRLGEAGQAQDEDEWERVKAEMRAADA